VQELMNKDRNENVLLGDIITLRRNAYDQLVQAFGGHGGRGCPFEKALEDMYELRIGATAVLRATSRKARHLLSPSDEKKASWSPSRGCVHFRSDQEQSLILAWAGKDVEVSEEAS